MYLSKKAFRLWNPFTDDSIRIECIRHNLDVNTEHLLLYQSLWRGLCSRRVAKLWFSVYIYGRIVNVCEHVPGCSLEEAIVSRKYTCRMFVKIILEIIKGVQDLHHVGLIHGDLSPSNVVVCVPCYGDVMVKIIDWCYPPVMNKGEPRAYLYTEGFSDPAVLNGCALDQKIDAFSLLQIVWQTLSPMLSHQQYYSLYYKIKEMHRSVSVKELDGFLDKLYSYVNSFYMEKIKK